MNISLVATNKCFGCSACSNECPMQCINMEINEYGEYRPVIDEDSCIECGKCTLVCPALRHSKFNSPEEVYAMYINNQEHRNGSASGGAARILYEIALQNGATVYGCDFDEEFILKMTKANSLQEIDKFRNSKYTYCRMMNVYKEIEQLLFNKKKVVFIGSSCQVDALKCYLKKEYDELVTIDLICHGVPPEAYFIEYISSIEKKQKESLKKIIFRGNSRKQKEDDYRLRIYTNSKCVYNKYAKEDLFFAGYVSYMMFEEKCYSCPYAQGKRISDITIGDWWGKTDLKTDKTSLVFANTEQGQKWVKGLLECDDVTYEQHTLEEAINSNEQLKGASRIPDNYYEMREYYKTYGFLRMAEKYILPFVVSYKKEKYKRKIMTMANFPKRVIKKFKKEVFRK